MSFPPSPLSRPLAFLRRFPLGIALLCLAVFALAASVAWGVFEAMPHIEDEHANLFQAMVFADGRLYAEAPAQQASFFIPFVIAREGKWFAKYTPGYPLLLALGVLAGAPWMVNALAAALAIAGVYLIGRDLFDRKTGLLAAALGAISPAFFIQAGSLLPHTVTLAALVFFAWGFIRARRSGEGRAIPFALLAGVSLGLAALSRPWTALAIGAPFVLLAAFDLVRDFRRMIVPLAALAVSCLAVASFLPIYNYAVAGSPFVNTYTLWWPYDTVGFGSQAGRLGGHTLEYALVNAKQDLSAFQTALLGWPSVGGFGLALLPLAAGLALAPRSRREWALLVPPLFLIGAQAAYWARAGDYYGARYYAESMPFLWILAARGVLKFGAGVWRARLVRLALPVLIAASIALEILPRFAEGRGLYDITRRDAELVEAAGLHHALVFVTDVKWTDYANLSWLNDPALDGDIIFVRDLGLAENNKVIREFPGRAVYYFDEEAAPQLSSAN